MTNLTTLTGILLLATLTETLVEYLVKPLLKDQALAQVSGLIVGYAAATLGVLLCLAYRADLLALAGLQSPWPWVGQVITGLVVGRGANFVHDFGGRWLRGR